MDKTDNTALSLEQLGELAHDIRSPLASVKAMAQLGIKKAGKGETGIVIEYLNKIDAKVDEVIEKLSELVGAIRKEKGDENIDSG